MPSSYTALLCAAVAAFAVDSGCGHRAAPPVTPGAPIAADPPETLGTMTQECDALMAALSAWRTCPNLDDPGRQEVDAWVELATTDFAAGAKANAPAGEQHEIAAGCHRATTSVRDAGVRCAAGPTPKAE